jgi:hypothetical protein
VLVVVAVMCVVVRRRKIDASVQDIADSHIEEKYSMQKLENSSPNHSPSLKRVSRRKMMGT